MFFFQVSGLTFSHILFSLILLFSDSSSILSLSSSRLFSGSYSHPKVGYFTIHQVITRFNKWHFTGFHLNLERCRFCLCKLGLRVFKNSPCITGKSSVNVSVVWLTDKLIDSCFWWSKSSETRTGSFRQSLSGSLSKNRVGNNYLLLFSNHPWRWPEGVSLDYISLRG